MKNLRSIWVLLAGLLVFCTNASADNPLIKKQGVCDGHIHIFGDKAYLFSTHDFNPHATGWEMHDWQLFSSPDLIHWTKEFVLRPQDTYINSDLTRCFAPDGATRSGKYYFYFSNGQANTGVAVSDTPNGPYKDALGKPLVSSYDPTPFIDNDAAKTPYFVWGAIVYQIGKLNPDMVSLSEPPRDIQLLSWQDVHDGSYLHKHNGTYYFTSQRGYYGTSQSVYGPYTYVGRLSPKGKGDYVDHPTFSSWHGQDFFTGNDTESSPYYRVLRMTYVAYKNNGEIVLDPFIYSSKLGVGQYDAHWDTIKAEWFFKRVGKLQKAESADGGFEMRGIANQDALCFPNVRNLASVSSISFRAAAEKRGTIEVHQDSPTGRLLGRYEVKSTGGLTKYQDFSGKFISPADEASLVLVFRGGKGELMRLDSFKFGS